MYMYIYIHVYIYIYVCIYIYMYKRAIRTMASPNPLTRFFQIHKENDLLGQLSVQKQKRKRPRALKLAVFLLVAPLKPPRKKKGANSKKKTHPCCRLWSKRHRNNIQKGRDLTPSSSPRMRRTQTLFRRRFKGNQEGDQP